MIKIRNPSKFDIKKGVSFRSSHFITIHLLLCGNPPILFFVRFRTLPYSFIIMLSFCISKLLTDSHADQQSLRPYFFLYIERRTVIAPFIMKRSTPSEIYIFLLLSLSASNHHRKQNTKRSSSKYSISYTPTNIIRYLVFLLPFFMMSHSFQKYEFASTLRFSYLSFVAY